MSLDQVCVPTFYEVADEALVLGQEARTHNDNIKVSSNYNVWRFSQMIIESRIAEVLHQGITRYPIYRDLSFAARIDGVVRAQGRKIIVSTNLPDVTDLDDSLIRPGRCFARFSGRELSQAETGRLLVRLCTDQGIEKEQVEQILAEAGTTRYSLAEIYKAVSEAKSR